MYNEVKIFADQNHVSVEDFIVSLIKKAVPAKRILRKKYKMKKIEELSPILQGILNMPRTDQIDSDDINGTQAREEYYKEKYDLA